MKDDVPVHLKFGYKTMLEKEAIRERLISEGYDPKDPRLIFAVSKAYHEAHKDDLTFSQKQDLARWKGERWVAPHSSNVTSRLVFSDEEQDYLIEKLFGVNDPIGQMIIEKLKKARI